MTRRKHPPTSGILIDLGTWGRWALALRRCSVNTREVSLHNPEALAFNCNQTDCPRAGQALGESLPRLGSGAWWGVRGGLVVEVEGDVPRRSRNSSRLLLQIHILIWKRDLDFLWCQSDWYSLAGNVTNCRENAQSTMNLKENSLDPCIYFFPCLYIFLATLL